MAFRPDNPYAPGTQQYRQFEEALKGPKPAAHGSPGIPAAPQKTQEQLDEETRQKTQERFKQYAPAPITQLSQEGPAEFKGILAKRFAMSEQGYDPKALEAMRSTTAAMQQAAQAQERRGLASTLAARGIRGGTQAALQSQLGLKREQDIAKRETQLALENEARKLQALGEYEKTAGDVFTRAQGTRAQDLAIKLAGEQAAESQFARQSAEKEAQKFEEAMKASAPKEKIICTELWILGLMSPEVYRADQAFGKLQSTDVMIGYHAWAKTVVKWMQASDLVTKIVHKIATPWANQMAFEMGVLKKPNLIGSILMAIGLPLCSMIGKIISKKVAYGNRVG